MWNAVVYAEFYLFGIDHYELYFVWICLIKKAYDEAYKSNYYGTDDSMLVENIGQEVTMIMGSYENIKITSPEDLNMGEQILSLRK